MRSALFAHSGTCLVSLTSTPIGHIIHARLIPASSKMFSRHALAGHRRRRTFHDFVSISSNCSPPLHPSVHLARAVERHDCLQRALFVSSLISETRIYF